MPDVVCAPPEVGFVPCQLENLRAEGWEHNARRAAAGSLLVHVLALALMPLLPDSKPPPRPLAGIVIEARRVTPLVVPPDLTQRDPNRGKVSKEVDLESLQARPNVQIPPSAEPSPRRPAARRAEPAPFQPPPRPVVPPKPEALPEPPKLLAETPAPPQAALPGPPASLPAPPQIQTVERPKLAFETPASMTPASRPEGLRPGRIEAPKASVEEAVRAVARSGRVGAVVVGDLGDGSGGLGGGLSITPSAGKTASQLELLSDPQGVDFRPYLITVLSAVRRNWFAVIPESAKMGRQGKVQLQFAISRDGKVPKLVIAMPSGTEALDRAAVAGVSASNPFPPLPVEFQGDQIRVQLSFFYNVPTR